MTVQPSPQSKGRRGILARTLGKRSLAAIAVVALTIGACSTVPSHEHLLVPQGEAQFVSTVQTCSGAVVKRAGTMLPKASILVPRQPGMLRVANWNLHKAEDHGWERDLSRFAAEADLLLLQEAVMTEAVARVLRGAGMTWRMAGAFAWDGIERGVLVAARAEPEQVCTMRAFEPLFPLPKSALVMQFRLADGRTLSVANLHSVNFTLGLGRYRDQMQAVAEQLAPAEGPMVWAGDFNAWSQERTEVLQKAAAGLKLGAIEPIPDLRRRAFGFALDHVLVRGFQSAAARTERVKSSDHNPVLIELTAP